MDKSIQLYIAIPFCPQRCAHCKKAIWPYDQTILKGYGIALEREIAAAGEGMEDYTVRSVYFGGGVPPLITTRVLRQCLAAVRRHFRTAPDMDVEVEALPANFTEMLAVGMGHDGMTHMLCNLGTAQRKEWDMLSRPYDYDPSLERLQQCLTEHRPPHLTMTVFYAQPEQTDKRLADTLRRAMAYKPQCIRLEPQMPAAGTALQAACEAGTYKPLPQDEALQRLAEAEALLTQGGYRRYSLRDYALPGQENRFEVDRLQDMERLGLGLGAASHYDGVFYSNTIDLVTYLDHSADLSAIAQNITAPDEEYLSRRRALLALSTPAGLDAKALSPALAAFVQAQLDGGTVAQQGDRLTLTPKGILLWDEITA
jgi:oxygen-independent coproporphyrinogen-3 oxidase